MVSNSNSEEQRKLSIRGKKIQKWYQKSRDFIFMYAHIIGGGQVDVFFFGNGETYNF